MIYVECGHVLVQIHGNLYHDAGNVPRSVCPCGCFKPVVKA